MNVTIIIQLSGALLNKRVALAALFLMALTGQD